MSDKLKKQSHDWYVANKSRHYDMVKTWSKAHPGYNAMANKKSRLKTKTEVITHMGGKCACCGETELEFLIVDHINGGGEAERRATHREGQRMYAWLRANNYPEGYQVLCFNCNWSKHLGGGTCVHKRMLCQII